MATAAHAGSTNIRRCPECGAPLLPESGCFYCRSCGFSLCAA